MVPNNDEYLAASKAAYKLVNPDGSANQDLEAPPGMKLIATSSPDEIKHGFRAAAFEDANGNVIIAYEGTQLNKGDYTKGARDADIAINFNSTPEALRDAAAFAQQVHAQHTDSPLYVTGHSLGGIEAQYAAKNALDEHGHSIVAGGATFGATGLPGNKDQGPGTIINYVDYGDPVANHTSPDQKPYGAVAYVGNESDREKWQELVKNTHEKTGWERTESYAELARYNYDAVHHQHSLANYDAVVPRDHVSAQPQVAQADVPQPSPDTARTPPDTAHTALPDMPGTRELSDLIKAATASLEGFLKEIPGTGQMIAKLENLENVGLALLNAGATHDHGATGLTNGSLVSNQSTGVTQNLDSGRALPS